MSVLTVFRQFFDAMGSQQCEIVLAAPDAATAEKWSSVAIEEVRRIQKKYSRYDENSVVSRLNASAGRAPVWCDVETRDLFNYADTLYQQSDGLFDITSGILRQVWDFKRARVPTQEALTPLFSLIGWNKVERTDEHVFLPHCGMELDFGGFAKEYATDRAAACLKAVGVEAGYVNLAGDIHVIGARPTGEPWHFGIQHPRNPALLATLPLTQGALATSGDYERFFEVDGQRYCHILNPKTGYPVRYWQSVSIAAPLALVAGSYSTLAMLKEEHALEFLNHAQVDYLAMNAFGELYDGSH